MSSAASATTSASAAKKVEWYHLDRVAMAKRICLDPTAAKLKTALNNNNNNNNNNNYNRHVGSSSGSSGSSGSTASSKSVKGSGSGSSIGSTTGGSSNNNNNRSTSASSTSTPFDIVHLLYTPGVVKPKDQSGNSLTTSASSRVTTQSPAESGSTGKGFFALRYNLNSSGSSGTKTKTVANIVTSVAGNRQFAALQQKRRRKAQRLAAAAAAATGSASAPQEDQAQKKAIEPQQQQRTSFLDEHGLIVNGGVKSVGGSCGSSSRSSSSGVSSDFEELDGTNTTSSSVASGSNMKVAASSAGSRQGGNCQSSSSSSECEEDDDEGASSVTIVAPSFVPKSKMCKNLNGSGSSSGTGSGTAANISVSGNLTNNNNNLSNLSVLNSLVMVDDGASGGGGGASGKVGKGGRATTDTSRTVSRKVAHVTSSSNATATSVGGTKSLHNLAHHGPGCAKVGNKMDTNGSSTLTRGKHANGSISSLSSASSTVSGSTDNDRDTDNSFSEFPADLDFIGVSDKGKRRTDRYDSSESSDSGVATLSPSTSDSPELISTCCDFSSEHLDVGNLISASRSSSTSNTSSSYPTSSSSSKSSSSSSSASTCSATSAACLAETQGDPQTGSVSVSTTRIIEAKLPSSSSTGSSEASSLAVNPPIHETLCQWKGCTCSTEATHNILEHIQTTHVSPQMKTAGYVCLWEGCKVFNKRSSSLSWLERHVLSHSGNKPFKCIFPGCGLSFSSQNALERHVNSHIATNGTTNGTQGNSTVANKKIDASPAKTSRRKKIRFRKQRINIGQRVDYFDKRIMEVIKHWLSSSVDQYAVNAHDITFTGEVIGRRQIANCERQVYVRWYPRFILNDEWVPESKFTKIKLVPLRRIPSDKIRLLYPALFPPLRQGKASRKRKPRSSNMSPLSPRSTSTHSEGSSSLTTLPPSPNNLSPSDIASLIDTSVSLLNSPSNSTSRSTRSSSSSSSSASLCSSFSSSASTSSTSSASSSQKSFHLSKSKPSASSTMMSMLMDTSADPVKSESEQEEDKCHKKFSGSLSCDCPSAPVDPNNEEDDDPSHWALQILYEDMGMFLS